MVLKNLFTRRHGMFPAKVTHEALVPIGLLCPQMEIAMGALAGISQREQHTEKSDGIGSSAQCHQHLVLEAEQVFLFDELLYPIF